jgi:AbrB family looped-hinge helix DNA binding protein
METNALSPDHKVITGDGSCRIQMVMVSLYGMKDLMVPIDQAGRLVLPKNVRNELAIKPGDTLKVSIHGASVTLTPNRESTGFVRKGKALVFSSGGGEVLSQETADRALDKGREGRDEECFAGLRGPKRRE